LNTEELARCCAGYALDKKAFDVKILFVGETSSLTDYILIASGSSDRQVQAVAEAIRIGMKDEQNEPPIAVEGMTEGRWALLDFGNIMVHVFQQSVREFYDLDGLWIDAPQIALPEETQKPPREEL
jgi:ribosome silencing factor RsfS/YbeB/iojap